MNPCTNGCQPPRSALFFRCPDRLIDPGSYVPLPPSSRVDPCRMFPSRRHRGSIRVVCFPPAVIAGRSMSYVPPPVRFSSRIVLPALCTSFPLPTVIPATAGIWSPACRPSRSLSLFLLPIVIPATAGIWIPASDVYPSRRLQHGISIGAEPVAVRSGLAMAERTLSTILIRTTRRVWFCGGRIPCTGSDRDLRVFYAYRPCLLYNLAHCERGGNAP